MENNYLMAIGIILEKDGKLLIGRRSPHKYKGGLWEFPSGRFKQGETIKEAIQREGKEELGVDISPVQLVDAYTFDRDGVDTVLLHYFCKYSAEPIQSEEHDQLIWADYEEVNEKFSYETQKKTLASFIELKQSSLI
ncbi:MAG: NUDIX domain-containing protein [Candidatus Kariarchaeaceae archaeon]